MNLYFAGSAKAYFSAIDKFLFSAYNDRKAIMNLFMDREQPNLFVDSGAWSAYTRGVKLDIDEYARYVNEWDSKISIIANLDVIPGNAKTPVTFQQVQFSAEKSWENFLTLRKTVKSFEKIIPVYHQGENIEFLERMLAFEDEYGKIDYIGIGALADTIDRSTRRKLFSKYFSCIMRKRPDMKVHAFGMTDLKLLEEFPFHSADSFTWYMSAANGEIITEYGRLIIGELRVKDSKYALKTKRDRDVISAYVGQYEFCLEELEADRERRKFYNIKFLRRWEENYKCKYGKIAKPVKSLF